MDTKKCALCGEYKPIDTKYFGKRTRSNGKVYWNKYCRPCEVLRVKEFNSRNPERMKKYNDQYHIKRNYGITREEYDQMLSAQNGACALCGRPPVGKYRLSVDHCHETGRVRGLLCNPCNSGLGRLNDDPELLRKAIEYIEGKR